LNATGFIYVLEKHMNLPTVSLRTGLFTVALAVFTFAPLSAAWTQETTAKPAETTEQDSATPAPAAHVSDSETAWTMLDTALNGIKDEKHSELRTQALAALGTMGTNVRAEHLIANAMKDDDLDVRTAAVLSAGQTKNRALIPYLRTRLDDKEPQVAFAAAVTLSKMNDRSGEDILVDVVNGDRKANAGLFNGTMHTMSKDLHNPTALAKIGALQGASMLLGPFGFGITAYEYVRKNGGESAHVTAITELAKVKNEAHRKLFIDALDDKDPAVRIAAAKALGDYHDKATASSLLDLFQDTKAPVRLTAAAAYLRSTGIRVAPKASATEEKE
jgi:HEAT repeat protein